jgi:hypothetical protein
LSLIKEKGINLKDINTNIIEEYFDIQFLNVFAKNYHSDEHPFFQQIFNELENAEFNRRISKDRNEYTARGVNIQEEIKRINQLIHQS